MDSMKHYSTYQSQFIEMFGNPLSQEQKYPMRKLSECCIINPRRTSVCLKDSDYVSFVPMPSVSENGTLQDVMDEEYGEVKKGFTYFENNDVLFAKITPCMENGKGAIAHSLTNGIGMGSTEFHILRPIKGLSNPYWLLCLTRMPIFRKLAEKNMSGTGGQKRVGAAFLENFMIGLPPIEAQNTFEELYKQADKSKFTSLKSQFIEMFEGNHLVALKDCCTVRKGSTITREQTINGEIPVVAGGIEPSCYHNIANRSADIITVSASGANAGYVNFWNKPIFASDCNTVEGQDPERLSIVYTYYALLVHQQTIYNLQKGGAQPHVYGKDLELLQIPIPPKEEQIKFVAIAQQADKSKYIN